MNKTTAVCFGEILFDIFPSHKKIGGDPLNVAARLKSFGMDVSIISAVGNDENGVELISFCNDLGINTKVIQYDENYPTGKVNVSVNQEGNASYDISYPSAWDKIELSSDQIELVENAGVFVYGSLSSRDKFTKKTLLQLLEVARFKIFDVNLRAPHYSERTLIELMNTADFIKFNDDELFEISRLLNSTSKSLEQNIKFIANKTSTDSICVTLGSKGAVLYTNGIFYNNCGFKVDVVNTVGSGDSFLAALITKFLSKVKRQEAINFACAVGAIVAQNDGANPEISQSEIEEFMRGYN